jgi:hypothetical protein
LPLQRSSPSDAQQLCVAIAKQLNFDNRCVVTGSHVIDCIINLEAQIEAFRDNNGRLGRFDQAQSRAWPCEQTAMRFERQHLQWTDALRPAVDSIQRTVH